MTSRTDLHAQKGRCFRRDCKFVHDDAAPIEVRPAERKKERAEILGIHARGVQRANAQRVGMRQDAGLPPDADLPPDAGVPPEILLSLQRSASWHAAAAG